ncbi:hypothetical protein [Embleya sp. NPDC001921]
MVEVMSPGCETCADLVSRGRRGRSIALYDLVTHHIEVHGTIGRVLPGCSGCTEQEYTHMLDPGFAARLRVRHGVEHALRIVHDPEEPLRFADMPRRGDES